MWLRMIFMVLPVVEPMRMGLLGLWQGVWGGQRIISIGYLGNNKALKARGGLSIGSGHSVTRNRRNGFIRHGNAQCGLEAKGSIPAELRQKGILSVCGCRRGFASHDGGFSSSFR